MITAQLCTIEERQHSFSLTYKSIRPQVDVMVVMLNGFKEKEYVYDYNVQWIFRTNDMTDANKFYHIEDVEGYVVICDDDLLYPPDYVKKMIAGVDKYKCVVSLHGRTYKKPFQDFYHIERNYRCLGTVLKDVEVDICGSGVMAYHTDFLKLKYSDFELPNMADVFVSKIAHQQKVKMMVLAHKEGYLKHTTHAETIFRIENDKKFVRQTEILKTFLN